MTAALTDLVARIRRAPPRVTVVGDAILDRWLHGRVRRLSREAPVPVVDAVAPEDSPGGAANTAMNVAALGARTRFLSVIGDDAEGRMLRRTLEAAGVDTTDVLVDEGRTTTRKTRVVGDDQIVVRVDEGAGPLSGPERSAWRAALAGIRADEAVLVCDYGSDLLDDDTVAALAAGVRPGLLVVDAHDVARWRPWRPDVVTPNAEGTATLLGEPLGGDRIAAVSERTRRVRAASSASSAVVTLDRDGTVVIEGDRVVHRTRARPEPEHQATGAGDTFAAALTVALTAGAPLPDAADFAQSAADVVVSRPGTAVCALADLAVVRAADPLATPGEVRRTVARARAAGRRIVFTNGCFDVLHLGHTVHLQQARALGDVLVVALNDDASAARLKGPGRPVNPLADRARMLAALGCVDVLTSFSDDSPTALLADLRPDVYAKGGTHAADALPETPVVRAYGGEVRILDLLPEHSTSDLAHRLARSVAVA